MIILKHLTVEHFRLLREINLHFPQRGSILIQGPNEAGKSALLESIYFALYGEPVTLAASDSGRRTLDDLILYDAPRASVTLTVSIGATEMTITRSIERRDGGSVQQVALHVRRLGVPEEEPITRLAAANERIIAELGCMDGETLRNSCFIEQKGLSRLEVLPGQERETTIRKLLGIEKLLRLTEQFELLPGDERMLLESTERLKLAEIQARIPEISQKLSHLEAALDAVTVAENLAEIKQQEEDIAEQELSLQQLRAKRAELKGHLHRIQQLQKGDITLAEISATYDALAEARRELPELDRQIAELDRREREELPVLEKRVNELTDLMRSFGTLERMSNDLLTTVSTIKKLEQELKQYQEQEHVNDELDEQIITARLSLDQVQQSLRELEERRDTGRPQLEARLQRLQELSERLTALHQAEQEYARLEKRNHSGGAGTPSEHSARNQQGTEQSRDEDLWLAHNGDNNVLLDRVKQDMQEAEQELVEAETEAQQAEQQVDALEKYQRQLSIGRQLEEWQRIKRLSQGLAEAEQQVMAAYQNQERLTLAAVETRQTANRWLMLGIGGAVLGLILGFSAFFAVPLLGIFLAAILGLLALFCFGVAGWGWLQYSKARKDAQIAHQQMQETINQVGRMVAARETAMRTAGNRDALERIEQEIRSLGGTVPRSHEEAQYLQLVEPPLILDTGEKLVDIADVQQRLAVARDAQLATRNRVSAKMEALSRLRQQWKRLEEQRANEHLEDMRAALEAARSSIEDRQYEVAMLAGQEGLPVPSFAISQQLPDSVSSTPQSGPVEELKKALADTIKAAEQEIASLDSELEMIAEHAAQVRAYQEVLDKLLARKREAVERDERFLFQNPLREIERTREQQHALRTALQGLQDSLRERVKPLGVAFGQAAVSNAEAAARKHLESLHITLGSRVELQSRRTNFAAVLKDRQESLSDHYNQLAKFSSSLGSWIVPPNPFTETLAALRSRCQQEIKDADESSVLQEVEKLQLQERASLAKVELCRQEIEEAQERIATMLVQRSRPPAKGYAVADIVAVWPLVGEYITQDRSLSPGQGSRLVEEHALLEEELQQLEQQELELSTRLHTGGTKLDIEQARLRKEQQERNYQTKKRANMLVKATSDRLLRKMLPRTEYYMQQILPLLTSGRYHDVRLTTKGEESSEEQASATAQTAGEGTFQLDVWDTGASAYVPKSLLSGGAADQLSLALRVAFAIAVLPRELAAAPGFVLLDEPLSSFDRARAQALVDVVTSEMLGQHFEQVLLVSHSSAFDPAMFPYHVYLDGGAVVESNLPGVPAFQIMGSNGHSQDNDGNVGLPADPVTPLSASILMES